MKKSDKISWSEKSHAELAKALVDIRRQMTESRIKQTTGTLKDTSVFKKLKYQVSLISTLISKKTK